jgi:hypothetical protein
MKNIGMITPRPAVRMLPFGNAGGDDAAPGTPPQSIAVPASTPGTLDHNQVVAVVASLKTKNWARSPFYVVRNDDWYGWMPHNASFGFLDIARPTLGQIHFRDRF